MPAVFFDDHKGKELKRIFTVRTQDDSPTVELYSINKRDLYQMRTEFSQTFAELFNDSVPELQKIISLRLHALDQCNQQFAQWVEKNDETELPTYKVEMLTNKRVKGMSHEEIMKFIDDSK